MFEEAYPGQRFEQMTFAHASNAIAGFFIDRLSFNNSPWDRFLAGDDEALTEVQLQGAKNFMSARCSICHNGPALTDNEFHNVAVAQFGPGKGDGPGGRDDFGRMRETGNPGGPLRLPHAAAPERGADRRPTGTTARSSACGTSSITTASRTSSCGTSMSNAARAAAPGHAAADVRGHPRDPGHAAQRRGLPDLRSWTR